MSKIRPLLFLLLIFLAVLTTNYIISTRIGDVGNVNVSFKSTSHHSENEIKHTMNLVKSYFHKNFKSCKLTDLWYDDKRSLASENEWKKQYNGTKAIILSSNFDVGFYGGDASLNPGATYDHWEWVLVQDSKGKWAIKTYGY